MRILIPGLLLFAVYVLIARWYFVCEVRDRCADPEAVVPGARTLKVTKGREIVLDGYEQIWYEPDSMRATWNQGNGQFFDDLAAWLRENSSHRLVITGRFMPAEAGSPAGFFGNIGLGRAAQAGLQLEARGIDLRRIELRFLPTHQDSLPQPLQFELLP